jgi:hypothetical protein
MTHLVRRKRYLLLASESEVGPEDRKEAVRLLLQRYPDLDQKKMVWIRNSLIFRTDQLKLQEMKLGLAIRVGEAVLLPRQASGSISKLKRAAESPPALKWSSSSQRSTSRKSNKGWEQTRSGSRTQEV